jgi:hypothetical protein
VAERGEVVRLTAPVRRTSPFNSTPRAAHLLAERTRGGAREVVRLTAPVLRTSRFSSTPHEAHLTR